MRKRELEAILNTAVRRLLKAAVNKAKEQGA